MTRLLYFLATVSGLLGICGIGAPRLSLTGAGELAWNDAFVDGFLTVESTTNMVDGVWLPYTNVPTRVVSQAVSAPVTNSLVFYRAIAGDLAAVPVGMVTIPKGSFLMGDNWNWDFSPQNERPLHAVPLDSFYIDKFEVSFPKMKDVLQYAYDKGLIIVTNDSSGPLVMNAEGVKKPLMALQGYIYRSNFIAFASQKFTVTAGWENYACTAVTWYGAAAFANFKSDMEGLQRCVDFQTWQCDFTKDGYRLPTEAEYEKAARGGMTGHHFPWPSYGDYRFWNYVSQTNANYTPTGQPHYFSPTPLGTYAPNGYGLYDIAGNMREWCWDWYSATWYSDPNATFSNPVGPIAGTKRILRGGGFETEETKARCAYRDYEEPEVSWWYTGFRCVRPVR